jgi:multiple sugar transport system substrate-binding protein
LNSRETPAATGKIVKNVNSYIQSLAGVGPDLFDFGSRAQLESYANSGILLDITDVAKAKGFGPEIVWRGARPCFMYNERQYGFPDNTCSFIFIYHKDVFEKAGIPAPKADWTWHDFLKIAPRLNYTDAQGVRHFALQNVDPMIMAMSNGAQMFTPDGTRCIFDSPEGIEALQFYYDLRYKYHYVPTASDLASQASAGGWGGGSTNLFATKYFAIRYGGRYEYIAWQRDTLALQKAGKPAPFHLGIAPLPRFKTPVVRVIARCSGINRNSKNVLYAQRFLEFLASESFNRQINRSFDSLASVTKYCEGPNGIADGPPPATGLETANDPLWVASMQYGTDSIATPFIPTYKYERFWSEAIGLMDAGKLTPANALHTFAKNVNSEIARNVARDPKLKALYDARTGKEATR